MGERRVNTFFDALETRDPAAREAALMAALPAQVRAAQATAALGDVLAAVDAGASTSRTALAMLPVTRKSQLLERQRASIETDPFGGFSSLGWRALPRARPAQRVYQSPGPIYEPESNARDYWRLARAMFAAGLRDGDLAHNCFSYHLTPGGLMMESGALALGCTVFPGGVGNTELQLQAMSELKPDAYIGTPSFLKILVEKATESGANIVSLTKAMLGGEAFPPSLRDWLQQRGIAAYQCYATADLGLIAHETSAREGLVLDEHVIVEIVRPGSGEPVADGDVGEVVVTTLNADYPLVRFGTGDLSAVMPGRCPTGRTNARIKGWMGRADQTAKVRGMFIHASQIADVVKRHPELLRVRLVVEGEMAEDRMTLFAEIAHAAPEGLADRVAQSLRDITKLRGVVAWKRPGELANDGKVIEDARSYR
jgi:phenylacetate-CoA ligase